MHRTMKRPHIVVGTHDYLFTSPLRASTAATPTPSSTTTTARKYKAILAFDSRRLTPPPADQSARPSAMVCKTLSRGRGRNFKKAAAARRRRGCRTLATTAERAEAEATPPPQAACAELHRCGRRVVGLVRAGLDREAFASGGGGRATRRQWSAPTQRPRRTWSCGRAAASAPGPLFAVG